MHRGGYGDGDKRQVHIFKEVKIVQEMKTSDEMICGACGDVFNISNITNITMGKLFVVSESSR